MYWGRSATLLALLTGCGRVGFDAVECGGDLAITPDAARTNVNSDVVFEASGGTPPYRFSLTGPGSISDDGRFASPPGSGTTEVVATDARGCQVTTTIETGGKSLWFIGGAVNEVPSNAVFRSDDGRSWTQVSTIPVARRGAVTLVYNDRIWVIGGTGAVDHDDVFVSADGVAWTIAGKLPAPNSYPSATVFEGKLWMIGGNGVPGQVFTSRDGAAWTKIGDVPLLSHGAVAIPFAGRLWYLGGHDVDNVFYAEARASSDGATWTTESSFPSERELMGGWVTGDKLIVAGGLGAVDLDEVVTTTDGITWTVEGALPANRYYGGFAELAGVRWAVGGTDGGAVWSSPDSLTWTVETTNFPTPRSDGGLVAFTPP